MNSLQKTILKAGEKISDSVRCNLFEGEDKRVRIRIQIGNCPLLGSGFNRKSHEGSAQGVQLFIQQFYNGNKAQ